MQIDNEDHREILLMAVANIPISGPSGDADLLNHVLKVQEILRSIGSASIAGSADPHSAAQEMLSSR